MSARVHSFLELAVKQGGSDLHLVSGQAPHVRIQSEACRTARRFVAAGTLEHAAAVVDHVGRDVDTGIGPVHE